MKWQLHCIYFLNFKVMLQPRMQEGFKNKDVFKVCPKSLPYLLQKLQKQAFV